MSSLFRRKLDELEDMFITSQDDLLARFSSTYEENARLKAEVERLRFIGDEIIMDVYRSECLTDKWCKMARKWNAAKEGKPHA